MVNLKDQTFGRIMHEYQQKRDLALDKLNEKIADLKSRIPELEQADDEIYSLNLALSRLVITSPDSDEAAAEKRQLEDRIQKAMDKKAAVLKKHGIDKNDLKPEYECDICNDAAFIEKDGKWVKCPCLMSRLIQEVYKSSNIMQRIQSENFGNFDISLYSDEINGETSPRKNIFMIKAEAHRFIDNFKNDLTKNLLFYGPPGLGKTYMCTCIAKELMDMAVPVLYYSSVELFEVLANYTFTRETFLKENSKEVHDLILTSDLLIIDDLGSELVNSFVINQLFNIINIRQMNSKKTIISTNLTPNQIKEAYGDRIFSRLVMSFDFYKFFGDDIRWTL